ncbi:MAG: phage antirepressor KilAC domain-containing protein [Sarcina sp.]
MELQIINEQVVLGKEFKVYGSVEQPLFLANDVSLWIEHSKTSMMLQSIDEDEKLKETLFTSGQNREMWFLTEDGLYEVLMQSRKPIAKAFKKEVKKILKQIRSTGGYIPTNEEDDDATIMAKALLVAQKTIERKNELIVKQQEVIEEQKPKVDIYNHISNCEETFSVGEVAKNINMSNSSGIEKKKPIGQKQLFDLLRQEKILMHNNQPYQSYVDNGYFVTKQKPYMKPNGEECVGFQTRVTTKGVEYIIKKLQKLGYNKI